MKDLKIILEKLKKEFSSLDYKLVRDRRIFVEISNDCVKKFLKRLKEEIGETHISTITGLDTGKEIEVIYHLWSYQYKTEISVRVKLDRNNPVVDSITDIIPGATLYEREVYEMVGVKFQGHPNLTHLLLPEDWPDGVYPLRKDVPIEKVKKTMMRL